MAHKRLLEGGESEGDDVLNSDRRKVPALRSVVMKALKMDDLQEFCSLLEPMVRRVVKEEVEMLLCAHLGCIERHCSSNQMCQPAAERQLRLEFMNKLCLPIFSGSRIEAEDGSSLFLSLVDSSTGQIVESGPESCMKVEIIVLEGDFEGSGKESWTIEDLKGSIVTAREGKRSLLVGDVCLDLNQGTGTVKELSFTDNSSWTRSRRFRLGAMARGGEYNGMRVMEAKTESFVVRDHRGELYKKNYPPALGDEVWRLEKIGKDGAFHRRLSRARINTVKDFLTLLNIDAPRLQNILGSGMSSKMWEITVNHAQTCTLNNMKYVYYPSSQKETGVVFNIVGQLLGVVSQNKYLSANDLSDDEKSDAQTLVKAAYDHLDDVLSFDVGSLAANGPSNSANLLECHQRIQNADTAGFCQPCLASSNEHFSINEDVLEVENPSLSSFDFYNDIEMSRSPYEYESEAFPCFDDNACLLSPSFLVGSSADIGTAMTAFIAKSASSAVAHVKADAGWTILVSVLRWTLSIKRMAKKRLIGNRRTR